MAAAIAASLLQTSLIFNLSCGLDVVYV